MAMYIVSAGGISLCNAVFQMMIICCNKQEAVVQGPNGRDVFFLALTHNWFNVAFCLCCGCLVLCLTWTRRKAGCSSPWCLWDSPRLITSRIRLPWWQHWIMWQLCPRQQRRQLMTPTSLCRTSACCCSMRTLGSPGETEEMRPWSDPGPGEGACFLRFWLRRDWGWCLPF